jgi:hypothetical protein
MNRIRIALPPVLFFSVITFAYAQQPESGQQPDSVKQEETKHPQDAAPPHKSAEANPSRESRPQQEKPPKPEKPEASNPPKEQPKADQEEHRQGEHGQGEQGQRDHGDNAQKRQGSAAEKSAHIPDTQFKAKFGHEHSFAANRVVTQTRVVPNQTQFAYGGYTFVFLDPWPAAWLFTDDCYIDYVDDQYFLFDPLHPEVRIALLVVE